MILLAGLALALHAAPQDVTTRPDPAAPADVTITGNRMRDALDKCLARGCSPEEEVDAAMSAGAESFAAGRYEEAGQILRRAISRNKQYAARMPGRISDLYATYADVAQHFGNETSFQHATLDSMAVLRRELGRTHPAAIGVSGRVGDMWVKLGKPEAADDAYEDAAQAALRAGNAAKAGELTFRRAWIALGTQRFALSRKLLGEMERDHGDDPRFAGFLRVLRARLALAEGQAGAIDALVAAMRGMGGARPVLVYSPPYPAFDAAARPDTVRPGGAAMDDYSGPMLRPDPLRQGADVRWVDIGFWVRADGKASDIEVLRPAKGTEWVKPLVKQIGLRRYAIARAANGDVGSYRVERFTLRSNLGVKPGTRVVSRYGAPTLQVIDLTDLSQRDGTAAASADAR